MTQMVSILQLAFQDTLIKPLIKLKARFETDLPSYQLIKPINNYKCVGSIV